MANFADEAGVRAKFQLTDAALVAPALVEQSIEDAHLEVLRRLDAQYDTDPPAAELVLGETLLAGAHLLRSLASKDAFDRKHVVIGGKRIEGGGRFDDVLAAAANAEDYAWEVLGPFLLPRAPVQVLVATDTVPVLGEE
jgi:hypothetical protein